MCVCLCHDTGGGVHEHEGKPCLGKMMIAYHGTMSREIADKILKEGFKVGTWFAKKNLADALVHGGPYIFTVEFDPAGFKGEKFEGDWQFWLRDSLGPEAIVALHHFEKAAIFERAR
jgi:hypothetical protein